MEYLIAYLLTMSYCIAPEGKSACERKTAKYEFTNATDCIETRNELVRIYDKVAKRVIVYREESKCEPRLIWVFDTYESHEEAMAEGYETLRLVRKDIGYE